MSYDINELKDLQSEGGAIGTLLIHPEFIDSYDLLKEEHFYDMANRAFFWAINELYMDGVTTMDAYNISLKVNKDERVKKMLEDCNISNIEESLELYRLAARYDIADYIMLSKNIIKFAYRREFHYAIQRLDARNFTQKNENINKFTNFAIDSLEELSSNFLTTNNVKTIGTMAEDLWGQIEADRNPDGTVGIPPKIKCLRQDISYRPQEMVMYAARMKVGKSIWCLNEAIFQLESGLSVLYIDTEMGDKQFFLRLLALKSGVDISLIETGRFNEDDEAKVRKALDWIKSKPLVHVYDPAITMDYIYTLCRQLQRTMDLDVLIYDYLKYDGADASENYNALGKMTNYLKNVIAGKLNLPVISCCQLNRNNDIADSDKIGRYVSTLVVLEKKTADKIATDGKYCGNFMAKILINRNGAANDVSDKNDYFDVDLYAPTMTFKDAKVQHSQTFDF